MDCILSKKWKYLVKSFTKYLFFSKDGIYNQNLLKNIDQFPTSNYFEEYNHDKNIPGDTCKYWIKAQEK